MIRMGSKLPLKLLVNGDAVRLPEHNVVYTHRKRGRFLCLTVDFKTLKRHKKRWVKSSTIEVINMRITHKYSECYLRKKGPIQDGLIPIEFRVKGFVTI